MTATTMALTELAEKGADIDVLRQMVQFMAQRLMELDVEARCGAGYDEKSPDRLNSRNGYRMGACLGGCGRAGAAAQRHVGPGQDIHCLRRRAFFTHTALALVVNDA